MLSDQRKKNGLGATQNVHEDPTRALLVSAQMNNN